MINSRRFQIRTWGTGHKLWSERNLRRQHSKVYLENQSTEKKFRQTQTFATSRCFISIGKINRTTKNWNNYLFFFLSFFVLVLTFPSDPQKVTLHHMAEVVVTWCQYQADHWPKSGKRRHFLIFLTYGKQMKWNVRKRFYTLNVFKELIRSKFPSNFT